MKKILITVGALIVMIGGVFWFVNSRSNAQKDAASTGQKLRVVTTNSILEDMVQNVGGERIKLYSIVKRGTDPHEYEPRPTDVAATSEANLVFHNGLNLETGGNGWFKKLVKTSHKAFGKDVFSAIAGVTPEHLTTNVKEEDPHAWLDLANGIQYVKTITKVLKEK
ncbi:MAG TPA: metal ABC transporter substrate-binding protein, partial [Lactobacillus sp.]|nr:metal ABC transporter substrate-binding protein [Lactobacillus sp.]